MREHLTTFLSHTPSGGLMQPVRESYESPLPRYVEDAFRSFLGCGIFGRGFIRCHCDACGEDVLVHECRPKTFTAENKGPMSAWNPKLNDPIPDSGADRDVS